jgi:hypothetical protein
LLGLNLGARAGKGKGVNVFNGRKGNGKEEENKCGKVCPDKKTYGNAYSCSVYEIGITVEMRWKGGGEESLFALVNKYISST